MTLQDHTICEADCCYRYDFVITTWAKLNIHYINTIVFVIYLYCLFKEATVIYTLFHVGPWGGVVVNTLRY